MFDTASISAALTSVKTIYDLLKNANDAQLAMKISAEVANVQSQLIEVQEQALGLQSNNQQLRTELDKYRSYAHHHSVTWRQRPDGSEDGPFCPACFGEGRDMPLIPNPYASADLPDWLVYCPRGHVDAKAKPLGHWVPKQEPIYRIPKDIVPKDRFYQARSKNSID